MVKGIIFDMDGVLADTEYYYIKRREKFLELMGFVRSENNHFIGSNERAIWETIIPYDPVFREEMLMGYRAYRRLHDTPYEELANPQMVPLFHKLKDRGLCIGIASSSEPAAIKTLIHSQGVEELVDYYISGEECTAHKPDPEIYQRALEKLDLSPEEAIAIEDSPTGILAAKRAGVKVCGFLSGHEEIVLDQSGADWIIHELDEVLEHV